MLFHDLFSLGTEYHSGMKLSQEQNVFFIVRLSLIAPLHGNRHYENLPMQYTEIFFTCKNWKFHQKKIDNFLFFFLLKT